MTYKFLLGLLCSALALAVVGLFMGLFLAYKVFASPTFELLKSQWTCIEYKEETELLLVGKVLVPVDDYVCQNYQRNN